MGIHPSIPLKPSGISWLGDIPSHWEVRRLSLVASIIAGQSPPSAEVSEFRGNFPFLQGNAEFGLLHPSPRLACETPRKSARRGDVLLSVRAPVGELNVADRAYGIGRGLCAIRNGPLLNGIFTLYILNAAKEELLRQSTGSTYDAVTIGVVGGLRIPLPPLEEQRAIVELLNGDTARIAQAIDNTNRMTELLQEYRARLIYDMVTGKMDSRLRGRKGG